MDFRILGPLEVRLQGAPVRLSGPREHKLLSVLLLSANRLVPMSRLVDGVWDDDPPATAKRQVQNGLSALRNRLCVDGSGSSPVVAVGGGYQIRAKEGEFDAQRFQDLVVRAEELQTDRPAERVRLLREGLALWRGPALSDISGRDIRAGALRLDEQRLAAYEWCIDLELDLGRHEALVGELTELVAAYPLRERPVGQLMRALYRSARKAEALQAYQALRERLADDVGLDPSAELQQLQLAILRGDLAAPSAGERERVVSGGARSGVDTGPPHSTQVIPRQLPVVTAGFVGRRAELDRLDALAAWCQEAGAGAIAVIGGTAGIGKTAVAVYWAHRAAPGFPDGQLYVNLRGFDPSAAPLTPAEAVRAFLDAFEVPPERIPVGLAAQSALYRSLLSGRRVLVVLDNARDTEQVRPLLPGSPGCLALVSSRNRLTGLAAIEGARPIGLDLLTEAEARELLDQRVGRDRTRAEPRAAEQIIRRCARLPLALSIVAARAAASPSFPLAAQADDLTSSGTGLAAFNGKDPATDVRGVFSWSYEALGGEAARLFRLLSLHPGPDLTIAAAAGLAGLPADRAQAAVVELAEAHLVAEHAPGRFGMHDLLRAYAGELVAAEDADAERRAAIHGVLDHYLHTAFIADRLLSPSRDPIELRPARPDAAPQALADREQAEAWFAAEYAVLQAIVELAADWGFDTHAWQLAWTLTNYLDWQGHWREQVDVQRIALAATRRLENLGEQARAHRLLAGALIRLRQHREADDHLRDALELCRALGDRAGQAETLHCMGFVFGRQGRHAEALVHAQQALDLYRMAGHRAGEANTLNAVGWYHALLGDHRLALTYCQQALGLQHELGNRQGEAVTWDSLGYAHHHLGQTSQAITCYRRALELSRYLGDRYDEAATLTRMGDTYQDAGALAEARAAWRPALRILDQLGHDDSERVRAKLRAAAPGAQGPATRGG